MAGTLAGNLADALAAKPAQPPSAAVPESSQKSHWQIGAAPAPSRMEDQGGNENHNQPTAATMSNLADALGAKAAQKPYRPRPRPLPLHLLLATRRRRRASTRPSPSSTSPRLLRRGRGLVATMRRRRRERRGRLTMRCGRSGSCICGIMVLMRGR